MQNLLTKLKEKRHAYCKKRAFEYQQKLNFLYLKTYTYFLKEINKQKTIKSVDIPMFMYLNRNPVNTIAHFLAENAIKNAEKFGHRHIEKCYKRCLKTA